MTVPEAETLVSLLPVSESVGEVNGHPTTQEGTRLSIHPHPTNPGGPLKLKVGRKRGAREPLKIALVDGVLLHQTPNYGWGPSGS